jgi:hypothetical protein
MFAPQFPWSGHRPPAACPPCDAQFLKQLSMKKIDLSQSLPPRTFRLIFSKNKMLQLNLSIDKYFSHLFFLVVNSTYCHFYNIVIFLLGAALIRRAETPCAFLHI